MPALSYNELRTSLSGQLQIYIQKDKLVSWPVQRRSRIKHTSLYSKKAYDAVSLTHLVMRYNTGIGDSRHSRPSHNRASKRLGASRPGMTTSHTYHTEDGKENSCHDQASHQRYIRAIYRIPKMTTKTHTTTEHLTNATYGPYIPYRR
jgi:hypothetical protein